MQIVIRTTSLPSVGQAGTFLRSSMKYSKNFKITILVLCVTGAIAQCDDREPNCYSRFDYEYKVLQKLLLLEESHNDLSAKLAASENEITKLEESHNGLSTKLAASENETNKLKNEISRLNDIVSDLNGNLVKQGPVVAFSAYVDKTTSLTSSAKTVFNRVLTNEHQAYDVSTGVFTCPISGIYVFSFVAAVRGDATTWAVLKVNNTNTLYAIAEANEKTQDLQGANIAVVKLVKGNTVWISGGGNLPGNSDATNKKTSSFSGFLVQPTTN